MDSDSIVVLQAIWIGIVRFMSLNKSQLRTVVNNYAVELKIPPITESVFESWITKGLLKGATPKGRQRRINPLWTYPEGTRAIVKKIVELKSQGPIRSSQLRLCLWLSGCTFEFDILQNNLSSEFGRTTKRDQKRRQWKYDHRDEKLSEAAVEKYSRQLPPLDEDLEAAGFGLPKRLLIEIISRAYWGYRNGETIWSIVLRELLGAVIKPVPVSAFSSVSIEIGGALGNREEIGKGGHYILERITEDDLKLARDRVLKMIEVLNSCEILFSCFGRSPENWLAKAYRKAANSFLRPEWMISSLALFSISAFNARTRK